MDLSKDSTSLSTILALLRNHERFAKWINGKPLGKFTYVSLRKDRNHPSKTVYVLLECDENKKPVRFLRVDEIAKLSVTDSKVPETAELTFDTRLLPLKRRVLTIRVFSDPLNKCFNYFGPPKAPFIS